jgi:hypothetical protein
VELEFDLDREGVLGWAAEKSVLRIHACAT